MNSNKIFAKYLLEKTFRFFTYFLQSLALSTNLTFTLSLQFSIVLPYTTLFIGLKKSFSKLLTFFLLSVLKSMHFLSNQIAQILEFYEP